MNNEIELLQHKITFKGTFTLSDTEILSIILGRGEIKESNIIKAKSMFEKYNDFENIIEAVVSGKILLKKDIYNLILSAHQLGARLKNESNTTIEVINNNCDVELLMRPIFKKSVTEEFWVLSLSSTGRIIDKRMLSQGSTSNALIDIKVLVKYVLNNLANSVIIAHNHPSGSIEPSKDDIELTKKISNALNYFDIKLLDHIIIGTTEAYSFREKGVL